MVSGSSRPAARLHESRTNLIRPPIGLISPRVRQPPRPFRRVPPTGGCARQPRMLDIMAAELTHFNQRFKER